MKPALRLCLSADQTLRYYILAFSEPQIVERCGSTGQDHDDCFRGTLDARSFPGRPARVRRDEPKTPRPCDPARSDSVTPKNLGDDREPVGRNRPRSAERSTDVLLVHE